mgnify:CR=1 FL=1
MPLNCYRERMVLLYDRFRNTVCGFRNDLDILARILHGLVMEGVDADLGFSVDLL